MAFRDRLNEYYDQLKDQDHTIGRIRLAEICGVTKPKLDGWLSGRTEPDIEALVGLSRRIGVSVSWLSEETDFRTYDMSDERKKFICKLPPNALQELDYYFDYLSFKYNISKD